MKHPAAPRTGNNTLRDFTADRRLLVLSGMALVTGSFGAAAAWALLKLIALFTNLAYFHTLSTAPYHLAQARLGLLSILVPVAGGVAVGVMARYGSDKIRGHGIPEALEAILIGQSRIAPKVAFLKPLSSAIAIGTGGPFGAEGPIIMTGGALGSLFAQFFDLSPAERKTLLVAGAAAGMTAIFGTPVAAVLLAVEVLLFEWKPRSFVPVAVSATVAAAWRPWLVGAWPLFAHAGAPAMPWWGLALCAAVGVIAGLQSALMSVTLYGVEDMFRKLPLHWMWWPALGGIVVGLGGWYDPAVLGVGYDNIDALINDRMTLHAAAALLIGKAVVWIAALSSGTSGGVLAPLLMMGGALGTIEAHVLPFGDAGFWALVAMSAVLGGTMRAPLTATVFAIELTGDLRVMPAVLAACAASFATTVLIMRRSILTERLARRGQHLSYEYSVDPFEVMRVSEIMAKPVDSLPATLPIAEAVTFFDAEAGVRRHKSYPVVDDDYRLVGVVSRSDVLRWTRDGWDNGETLRDHADTARLFVGFADEPVGALADRMASADIGRAPIIDRQNGQLVGLVARRDLLRVRAQAAQQEQQRESALRLRP
ncbi:MAG: chloride channel protein [Alphaproteobacteria bacterium]|nr:chloride channel protein [Alphaproteobacteria bacterium]MBU6472108.1 chloride channel protein [Alphaproteobacteria bacterium]MDE2353291.1 chloride channel protein [Alphaproteobacteria bacterium]